MSQHKTDAPGEQPNPAMAEAPAAADKNAGRHTAGAADGNPARSDAPADTLDDGAPARAEQAANGQQDSAGETTDDARDERQAELAALREALEQKTEEAERCRDQALRAAAEADNVRKRAQRDVESARKFALEKFAGELLGVRDSLEMGLQAGAEEQADVGKLVEGMELTGRMLASAMEKFGIEVVNPEGEAFDPELHEAVSTQPTDAQAPNTVVTVVQKGYTLKGRVLRAAMVVVARAPDNDG